MHKVAVATMLAALGGLVVAAAGSQSPRTPGSGPLLAGERQEPTKAAPSRPPSAPAAKPAAPGTTDLTSPAGQTAVVKQFCTGCHNDKLKRSGLTLAGFDAALADKTADVTEKMIRKLRAGQMPPSGARRPDQATIDALAAALETRIDEAAATRSEPGWRPFQRLNRAEYARAIRDLLAIEVDVSALLPPDTISHSFDNIAEEQPFTPTLMESYLRSASVISRLAVGDRSAPPASTTYKVPKTASQMRHLEGTPVGTRGGYSVVHIFPADGEYQFEMLFHTSNAGDLFGMAVPGEQIEVAIDGERVALLDVNPKMHESDAAGASLRTLPIHVNAGPRRVSAAFIERSDSPVDDLIAPIEHTLAEVNIGEELGITALPHLKDFVVNGPHKVTGVSQTPSRSKVFSCRPTTALEEPACAEQIIKRLATEAFRGQATAEDFAELMRFYEQAEEREGFEGGIRMALQAILAHPRLLFRLEEVPAAAAAGQQYRIRDVDLASRLSFFLWGAVPDVELVAVAAKNGLRVPAVLDKQVRRMLADPRSEALASRFAAQWLRLQDVDQVQPDTLAYPMWDRELSQAFKRETELFFNSIVQEDRSVLDLLTADYTFVDERLARHYRIPNVLGHSFRRVQLPDPNRRGILGHGSVLLLTSVADRTSPVMRGKWVMEVLLGTPPPPPPPNIPDLEETEAVKDARLLSVRERLEMHRANPACTSCHRVMDPVGLALENFDATGAWRIKDNGVPIDATGELYDGTPLNGPSDLRNALLKRSDVVLLYFTESLMTYALGRPVAYRDMPAIRAIVREAARNDNRLSSFILGVVNSAAFRMSRLPQAQTNTVARLPDRVSPSPRPSTDDSRR